MKPVEPVSANSMAAPCYLAGGCDAPRPGGCCRQFYPKLRIDWHCPAVKSFSECATNDFRGKLLYGRVACRRCASPSVEHQYRHLVVSTSALGMGGKCAHHSLRQPVWRHSPDPHLSPLTW